jgi:hypothetical protein
MVEATSEESRDILAKHLFDDGKLRGPEKSPGYPEHVHPASGPYSDVHIQASVAAKITGVIAAALISQTVRAANDQSSNLGDFCLAGLGTPYRRLIRFSSRTPWNIFLKSARRASNAERTLSTLKRATL